MHCGGAFCPAATGICDAGVCQSCDVICSGSPGLCGTGLQAAIDAGGTNYVCPGRYRGGFVANAAVTLIGAGDGADATSSTILDARGTGTSVLRVNRDVGTVELRQLRLTGANTTGNGGGLDHFGTTLQLSDCTVAGNTAAFLGGGIYHEDGFLQLTRCAIRSNHTPTLDGAGIYASGLTVLTDCLVEQNNAAGDGGGLYISDNATILLEGTTVVRGNTAQRGAGILLELGVLTVDAACQIRDNTATDSGGGIERFAPPSRVILAAGSLVCGNKPDQCIGFSDPACQDTCPA